MALRGRRSGMAVLDGLGGPSYKTSVCDRVQYIVYIRHDHPASELGTSYGLERTFEQASVAKCGTRRATSKPTGCVRWDRVSYNPRVPPVAAGGLGVCQESVGPRRSLARQLRIKFCAKWQGIGDILNGSGSSGLGMGKME